MKLSNICFSAVVCAACFTLPSLALAQGAGTRVGVGPGHASASGHASGLWKLVETKSHVGGGGNLGRALAVGVGPRGVSLSHSIGVHGGVGGAGHNFNLSIGQGGTHVSHGAVMAGGPGSGVVAGGQTQHRLGAPQGGSTVTGFGRHVRAYSRSQTHPFVQPHHMYPRPIQHFRRFP